ncbi:NAD-dependent epimerase/dehydratase family protein [Leuconostoc carnosum]|uniref:NADH dehydrogenase n=2 Tax=Leuconostoc carnosum TaxID=1252 RepID=K0DEV2_LEUCJ|nr:NAD-dependent epimerase/dehydratase family protein [Leuconostoc carnosum]AFT82192.1 NADH dehydrogenase [Leuconostoc carnosum JB16]KAA8327719.1 NAD-dependent epimerase/dehydratase family protein [Leuconostoc carnosum]QEA33774.1 NAD-dependent epimerase/dehydratase family protein [Leuconostoc carnosum]
MDVMKKQKIVIAGGTGFVGQGIIQQLSPEFFEVHSLSRHPFSSHAKDQTFYHAVDLSNPTEWQHIVADADWIIDAIGILLPNPIKKQNYQNSSYEPAKSIIDVLVAEPTPKFLFISANTGPFFMKPYLNAKRAVENEAKKRLASRAYFVYPGIIFDKARYSSYLPGLFLTYLSWIKYFNNLRPISRRDFATNIENILLGKKSTLQQRS